MYQVPTPVWNAIAKTQVIKHQPWMTLFSLKADQQLPALADLENQLSDQKADSRTIRAYLLVAPLLLENVAISKYLQATNQPGLRGSMPELTTIREAVALATTEFNLTPTQQAKLHQLLTEAYKTPPAVSSSATPTATR